MSSSSAWARRLEDFVFSQLPEGVWITGSDTRDSLDNIYFLTFDFRGFCAIVKCRVSE